MMMMIGEDNNYHDYLMLFVFEHFQDFSLFDNNIDDDDNDDNVNDSYVIIIPTSNALS